MPPGDDDTQNRAAYLPIGLVFLILGLSGLFNDSFRYGALAFVPVGVVFLILAMQGRSGDADDDASPAPAAPPAPDEAPGTGDARGRPSA